MKEAIKLINSDKESRELISSDKDARRLSSLNKEAIKSNNSSITGKLFILTAFLIIVTLLIFSFTSCCNLSSLADRFIKLQDLSESESTAQEAKENAGGNDNASKTEGETNTGDEKTEAAEEAEASTADTSGKNADLHEYGIAYFEVTSSSKSNHFEHRVGNIYAVTADGEDQRLVYSDIDNEYDLNNIFSASPDGKKIIGMLADGGRGAYSAICVIDVLTGKLTKLVEFDFTESESGEVNLGLYGKPIWSGDSTKIAYELITNPYLSPFNSNFRDAGLFVVDVQTGEQREVAIDVGGASMRSTTFLEPVFFAESDSRIFMVSHPYYEHRENGEITNFYTLNDTLYRVDIGGGVPVEIVGVGPGDFIDEGPEIISSFDNFRFIKSTGQIVFQVLGDFEEDGDLWTCNYDGGALKKLTGDDRLREQQFSVYDGPGGKSIIAYTGSLRYGTISAQIPSGDIFIVDADGSGNKKLTDFQIGPSTPSISPDGVSVAFLYSRYDDNMESVQENHVMIYDLRSGVSEKISSEGYIVNIAGWVKTN